MENKDKILGFINDESYTPLKAEEIAVVLMVPKTEKQEFNSIIEELVLDGELYKTNRGKLISTKKMGYIKGKYSGSAKGFGFVVTENDDIFIPREYTYGAMHGDTVLVLIVNEGIDMFRREGKIVRILTRKNKTLVGILKRKNKDFYVEADNNKIWQYINVKKQNLKGGLKGQKVCVKITKYPTDKDKPEGVISEILGWPENPDVKLKSVMLSYGLNSSFPEEVLREAKTVSSKSFDERRDIRKETVITIDGEDAKDLDDAISLKIRPNGNYLLSVHIADVSHYVTEGSALDKEALSRGTSVYLPGQVVPMLPPALSNGICSLSQDEERLTLSVDMEFDETGNLISHDIYKSVIINKARMTYSFVQSIIEKEEPVGEIEILIKNMYKLSLILRKKREGFLDFDFPETALIFDDDMNILGVTKREITDSNRLIEEFMLSANNCIAEHFFWLDAPFVYRVHETPDSEKITSLKETLSLFDIKLRGSEITPGSLAKILEDVKGKPYELVVSETILRAMKKARYSNNCLGHFGLSAKYYCHFTSPIRRYPDLLIHRIIKEYLETGFLSEKRINHYNSVTEFAAKENSDAEINAQEAERTAVKIKIAEYMAQFVGETFIGTVSSVAQFGIFVRLQNYVEGLLRFADMTDDYYNFVPGGMYAVGEKSGKEYHLGEELKVKLVRSNEITGEIDFVIAE